MNNVLLQTDLSVQSLWPIHNIVKEAQNQVLTIHVLHLLGQPTSISDLLFVKQHKPYRSVPEDFKEALQALSHKYLTCKVTLKFEFVYGSTSRFLNNLMEARKIDAVYLLANYAYKQPLPNSVDFTSFLNKSKVPVHRFPLHAEAFSEYQILSALLQFNEDTVEAESFGMPEKNKARKHVASYS